MMMNRKAFRILAVMLAALLLLFTLISCGGNTPPQETEPPAGGGATAGSDDVAPESAGGSEGDGEETVDPSKEQEIFRPEEKNFGGVDFVIGSTQRSIRWIPQFVAQKDGLADTTDAIEYALYARQETLKSTYGVNVTLLEQDFADFDTANSAGQKVADAIFYTARNNMAMAQRGALCNLLALEELNLKASYYDQRIQKEYRIGNRLFALEGDMTTIDEMITMCVLYNDNLYDENGYYETYGTPYKLVDEMEWTFETMLNMAKEVSADSDGDGDYDQDDTWGIVSEINAVFYMAFGSGIKSISNQDGVLTTITDDATKRETLINALQKTMDLANNPTLYVLVNRDWEGDVFGDASDVFADDRGLFRHTSLSAAYRLEGNMDGKFGLLPVPAMEEDQDGYYCWINSPEQYPLGIPTTVTDKHETAEIVEIYAYLSRYGQNSLYSAFFDRFAQQKFCESADDIAMLELIFKSKTYDLDRAIGSNDVGTIVGRLVQNNQPGNLVSAMNEKLDNLKTDVMDFVLNINNNAKD